MTYKLEPIVEKIEAHVLISLPDGTVRHYTSGAEAAASSFDHHYVIEKISAVDGEVVLMMKEVEMPVTAWIGEEQVGFF